MDHPLPDGTAKNRPSTIDFGHRQPIEGESTIGGRLREIGDRVREIGNRLREIEDQRKREEEEEEKKMRRNRTSTVVARRSPARRRPRPVTAHGSPARCRLPHSRAIFLPREETEHLPARGERSRRHRPFS
ncbi:hypothetical protein BHE74_00044651 [Ensete ventricosum]|nr:hypothetical protein BHE74_00044651 [Ensete ventricosum]